MKIVVCVKYVPDAAAERSFREEDKTVDRAAADGLLSELDEHAVEEALTLVEASGDGEVVALSMGPDDASQAVRKTLQMGADAGVHVCDEVLHGSDAASTSLVLAAALRKIGSYDLVMCGMASTDGGMSVVPAMLAERLGVGQATFASAVEVGSGQVRIRRDGETATETIEADLPAVVSVTDQCNEPRYPSFKQIMAAKKKPFDTWSLADLEVEPGKVGLSASRTTVAAFTPRPARTRGTIVTDEGEGGLRLAEFLAEQKFI